MSSGRKRAWRSRHKVQLGSVWIVVLLILLLAALLFTAAVMLGNHLRRQAEQVGEGSSLDETTTPDFDSLNVPEVIARAAVFGEAPEPLGEIQAKPTDAKPAETDTPLSPDVTTDSPDTLPAPADGATAQPDAETSAESGTEGIGRSYNSYCVIMRGEDGALNYRSELRDYLLGDGDDSNTSLPKLRAGIESFGDAYLSGIFHVGYPAAGENMRQSVRSYEISLAVELADFGFDDIVITGLSFDADAADFCAAVKERSTGSCRVGIALDYEFLTSSQARESLVRLGGAFDFIAVDLYTIGTPAMMSSADALSSRLYIVRSLVGIYHMRALIPNEPGLAAAAIEAGAVNIAEIITD